MLPSEEGSTLSPSAARPPLPDRQVNASNIEDAYVDFILHCNPCVPPGTDTTALREAFRALPKSGGKSFSPYLLFDLIKQFDTKQLRTWAELAIKLGVDPPGEGESGQKIQQYAARLKRWMKSMHVDAFFEYLMERESPYWIEIPDEDVPIAELEREGVLAEDDMALRALLPHIKPKRGRRRPGEDDLGKSPRPSPQVDEGENGAWRRGGATGTGKVRGRPPNSRPVNMEGPFSAFPATPGGFKSASPNPEESSTNLTGNGGVMLPRTSIKNWGVPAASPLTTTSPVIAIPSPIQASPIHPSPVESVHSRPAKRSRLSLQVPERVGGEVRLATPPPVVMVNGQTTEPPQQIPQQQQPQQQSQQPGHTVPGLSYSGVSHSQQPIPRHPANYDPLDKTNMAEVEGLFMTDLMNAEWFDARGNKIPACSGDEAWAFTQAVLNRLRSTATSTQDFLINLSALAGGGILMPKKSLKMIRLAELPDRTKYKSHWQLRYGSIIGDFSMEEEVMHSTWKKKGMSNGTEGGGGAVDWEQKYKELMVAFRKKEEESMGFRKRMLDMIQNAFDMPRQYVVFGRPVPRLGSRHISLIFVCLGLFALFSLLFSFPSSDVPVATTGIGKTATDTNTKSAGHKFGFPKSLKSPWLKKLNPFKQPSHPPPRQKNDTDGESSWYADWRWLTMPFSSSITLDENRAVLPMLNKRTPIYCYYDTTVEKDKANKEVESDLLLAWRRAWWAKGFQPTILSPAEAMNNPLYEELQKVEGMTEALTTDLMRWLAWDNMGGGLLAHYLLFPMGAYDDPLLTYLRRGEFPSLTRWNGLDDGLFVGPKAEVEAAIKLAMAGPHVDVVKGLLAAIPDKSEDPFTVDSNPKALAFYSARNIETKYSKIGEEITTNRVSGMKKLNQLINAHLHLAWQNTYHKGISVVKPLPHHTTHLIKPAYKLAQRLSHCPESPLPNTCPPNMPKCTPCDDSHPLPVTTPAHYVNTSEIFTIGTVPHPLTMLTLSSLNSDLTISFIRRHTDRDPWIYDLTTSISPKGIPAAPRVVKFKEIVASDPTSASSLWLPAENPFFLSNSDLEWIFGLEIPSEASYPNEEGRDGLPPMHDKKYGPIPEERELAMEERLLEKVKVVINEKKERLTGEKKVIKEAVEAWNLADGEAWRFVRAWLGRGTVERRRWEGEERRYVGGMGSEKKRDS
ncbi:ARS binding protein 2-domain-containing protein [Triangularia verruculosa]|uniref:ARS binding protein 2-domain-containing protein n=1 Tax=Triangularia verruculosa TaxID=2587418 RepID=A0AAN7AY61_9PEZI|nr:ARS binding protein 2-domain-containing protein [Triangularia verruculosa]